MQSQSIAESATWTLRATVTGVALRAEALRDVGCAPVDPVVTPAVEALGFVAAAVWIGVERARSLF